MNHRGFPYTFEFAISFQRFTRFSTVYTLFPFHLILYIDVAHVIGVISRIVRSNLYFLRLNRVVVVL